MGSADQKSGRWREKISHEMLEYAINVVYLTLIFAVFTQYRRLLLAAHGIDYTNYWVAVIQALVLGKVIMVGNVFRLGRGLERQLAARRHACATLAQGLHGARPQPQPVRDRLAHLDYRLKHLAHQKISRSEAKLNTLSASLSQLDPHAVLNRGYAIALGPDGRPVHDAASLQPGDALRLTFARGAAHATVDRVVAAPKAQ